MARKPHQELIDSGLHPELPPAAYAPSSGAVLWRSDATGSLVQEIYRRAESTFGFAYFAWVAWRDAGGVVRNHTWHRVDGIDSLIAESADTARTVAEADAARRDVVLAATWRAVV